MLVVMELELLYWKLALAVVLGRVAVVLLGAPVETVKLLLRLCEGSSPSCEFTTPLAIFVMLPLLWFECFREACLVKSKTRRFS